MKVCIYPALVTAGILLSSQALANDAEREAKPFQLSAVEMDRVTAGVGADNVAAAPWPALLAAGFSLNHNPKADHGLIDQAGKLGVAVPSAVPHSKCIMFC